MEKIFEVVKQNEWDFWKMDIESSEGEILTIEKLAVLDPTFWKSLEKSCGWTKKYTGCPNDSCGFCDDYRNEIEGWEYHAIKFHEINLKEGWEKAVEYLSGLLPASGDSL